MSHEEELGAPLQNTQGTTFTEFEKAPACMPNCRHAAELREAGATYLTTSNTEAGTALGSDLLLRLGIARHNQLQPLVRALRRQMDARCVMSLCQRLAPLLPDSCSRLASSSTWLPARPSRAASDRGAQYGSEPLPYPQHRTRSTAPCLSPHTHAASVPQSCVADKCPERCLDALRRVIDLVNESAAPGPHHHSDDPDDDNSIFVVDERRWKSASSGEEDPSAAPGMKQVGLCCPLHRTTVVLAMCCIPLAPRVGGDCGFAVPRPMDFEEAGCVVACGKASLAHLSRLQPPATATGGPGGQIQQRRRTGHCSTGGFEGAGRAGRRSFGNGIVVKRRHAHLTLRTGKNCGSQAVIWRRQQSQARRQINHCYSDQQTIGDMGCSGHNFACRDHLLHCAVGTQWGLIKSNAHIFSLKHLYKATSCKLLMMPRNFVWNY